MDKGILIFVEQLDFEKYLRLEDMYSAKIRPPHMFP